jgi:hypothetical protein
MILVFPASGMNGMRKVKLNLLNEHVRVLAKTRPFKTLLLTAQSSCIANAPGPDSLFVGEIRKQTADAYLNFQNAKSNLYDLSCSN